MKKQNIWNEDAWSKINKGEFNSGGFLEQKKNGERDFSSKAIQPEQFRAEFSDFNVDGLRKFQDSQKYAVKNPLLNHKREMDFELGTNQNSLANDFLNWDMNPEPQKGPIVASENVEEFSQFNFSSAHKPSTVPNDEFFNVSVSPQHINSSSAGPGQNFWDEFGENPSQTPGKSVDPFSETHPACLNDKKISNEMLLKLSLDPDEKEELEIVEESKPVEEQPQQSTSTKEPNSFLDIELN